MKKNNFSFLALLFVFISCNKNAEIVKKELVDYVKNEDNGLSQTIEVNGVKINLAYRPTDLMVYQEMSVNNEQKKVNKDSIRNKYKNHLYFILSYSRDNKELLSTIATSREEFNNVQNILTFDMRKRICLLNQDKDTIPLIDYNFPRTYGMARANTLLFVFKKDEVFEQSDELIFNVKDIGIGTGDVKFRYNKDIIRNNLN